jgi:hypothetical protein
MEHLQSLIEYSRGSCVPARGRRRGIVRSSLPSRTLYFLVLALLLPVLSAEPPAGEKLGGDVLNQYLENHREQRMTIRDVEMKVDIEANLPDLQKKGVLQALRKVSEIGKITYKTLGFEGDNMVKKDVIARYIEAEVKASDSPTRNSLAINTDNYKFEYWGRYGSGDWTLHLFELKPRKKRLGLYAGWLWINAATGMPVRESGRFIKTPSVFLKRVDFIKDYEMVDGIAVPSKIESQIHTRLVGTAEIKVQFTDYSFRSEAPQVTAVATQTTAAGRPRIR